MSMFIYRCAMYCDVSYGMWSLKPANISVDLSDTCFSRQSAIPGRAAHGTDVFRGVQKESIPSVETAVTLAEGK